MKNRLTAKVVFSLAVAFLMTSCSIQEVNHISNIVELSNAPILLTASSENVTTNVTVTVKPQQAVYERWSAIKPCISCKGVGYIIQTVACSYCFGNGNVNCKEPDCPSGGGWHSCASCGGDGYYENKKVVCPTCKGEGSTTASKDYYVDDITADNGSLPADGLHTDGYWYIFKNLVED